MTEQGSCSQPFGVIIPGNNVNTNFRVADASHTKFTIDLPFPSSSMDEEGSSSSSSQSPMPTTVADLVFFLLPNIPLPTNTGALLYWSAAPMNPMDDYCTTATANTSSGSGFELLGALTPTNPSAIFRTGWSTHEQLLTMIHACSQAQIGIIITLGVSIEPLDNIENLQIGTDHANGGTNTRNGNIEDKTNVAQKIATDLFNYLQSFDDVGNARNGWMTVPTNVFERWFKRFEGKVRRDPNFFMKTTSE